jgi:hypothetical protein
MGMFFQKKLFYFFTVRKHGEMSHGFLSFKSTGPSAAAVSLVSP